MCQLGSGETGLLTTVGGVWIGVTFSEVSLVIVSVQIRMNQGSCTPGIHLADVPLVWAETQQLYVQEPPNVHYVRLKSYIHGGHTQHYILQLLKRMQWFYVPRETPPRWLSGKSTQQDTVYHTTCGGGGSVRIQQSFAKQLPDMETVPRAGDPAVNTTQTLCSPEHVSSWENDKQ